MNKSSYTHLDINRYLQKQMTAEEMHAFEKAMLNDPFLADAFDGFQQSDHSTASEHLEQIRRELAGKKERAGVFIIPLKKAKRWKVAALLIVLAGIGITIFNAVNKTEETGELARIEKAADSDLPYLNDTIKPIDQPIQAPVFAQKETAKPAVKNTSPVIVDEAPAEETAQNNLALAKVERDSTAAVTASIVAKDEREGKLRKEMNVARASRAPDFANEKKMANARDQIAQSSLTYQNREFRGRVLDNNRQPLPFANVQSSNNVNTMTDNNGNFTIKAPDTLVEVSISSIGYGVQRSQLRSNAETNEIVLTEPAKALEDVVVVGYGTKRKSQSTSQSAAAKTSELTAEPIGGIEKFEEYISERVKKERESGKDYLSGDVLVEFKIDKNGKPGNFKIDKQVNKAVAEKATELLEKGPRWKRKSKKEKVSVLLKF